MSAQNPSPAAVPPTRSAVEMSDAEKYACEREARHDVLARGRITDVAPVQHYLSHTRTEAGAEASRRHEGEERSRPRPGRPRRKEFGGLRDWLRWGEEGGVEHPVIPRC